MQKQAVQTTVFRFQKYALLKQHRCGCPHLFLIWIWICPSIAINIHTKIQCKIKIFLFYSNSNFILCLHKQQLSMASFKIYNLPWIINECKPSLVQPFSGQVAMSSPEQKDLVLIKDLPFFTAALVFSRPSLVPSLAAFTSFCTCRAAEGWWAADIGWGTDWLAHY